MHEVGDVGGRNRRKFAGVRRDDQDLRSFMHLSHAIKASVLPKPCRVEIKVLAVYGNLHNGMIEELGAGQRLLKPASTSDLQQHGSALNSESRSRATSRYDLSLQSPYRRRWTSSGGAGRCELSPMETENSGYRSAQLEGGGDTRRVGFELADLLRHFTKIATDRNGGE